MAFNVMLCLSVFVRSCQLSPSLPSFPPPSVPCCLPWLSLSLLYPFLFITLASPLPQLLGVFLLHSLMRRSMASWVLFIYGHALSLCVGLSNIHLSCAAIIQSLIPSHIRGMKHMHWSLPRSPSLNTPSSKSRELCRAQCALLQTTKKTNSVWSFLFLLHLLCSF